MSSIGRLLTPYTYVKWGNLELSAWDYGESCPRPVVFDVEFSLEQGESKINSASMSFDPSPVGFSAYAQCTNEDNLQKPITIRFGYESGSFIETVYYFQDVEFVTGAEQSIRVNLSGLHKASMNASYWSEYIGDGTKEFDVKELWDTVTKKIGYTMKWSKEAEEKISNLPKISRAAIVKETVGSWLLKTSEKYGLVLGYPTSSEGDHKTITVTLNASDASSNGTLKVEEKSKEKGKEKNGGKRIDTRYAFILGPTLVGTIKRMTNPSASTGRSYADTAYLVRRGGGQKTSTGQLYSGATREPIEPGAVGQIPQEKLESLQNTAIGALVSKAQKAQGYIESTTENLSPGTAVAAPTAVEQAIGDQSGRKPPGTAKPEDKRTTNCEETEKGKKRSAEARAKCEKRIADAKLKKEVGEYSACSLEIFMVPYMVGVQPKDFIVFPSLNYSDPYIEDWEVKTVRYKQQGAAVILSLEGQRPKPGADPLIVEKDLEKLKDKVKSLKCLKDWENYYWSFAK